MKTTLTFTEGSVRKNLFHMVTPLFLAMCLTMMYNMVDSLWVGNLLGEQSYAALTCSTSVILILNAVAMGSGNGISILLSQLIGAGKKEETECLIAARLAFSFVFAVIITIAIQLLLPYLLKSIGTPAEIYDDACTYLFIYLFGYVFFYLYMQITAVFRSFGDSLFQMKGMFLATIFNAVIDPVFIHFMGLAGAAWATVLSQILCLLFAFLYHKKRKLFSMHWKAGLYSYLPRLFKMTVPAALQQCMPAISSAVMVALVSQFGVITIAAYGVITKIEILLLYPAMAMNMAVTAIVGQCAGAERIDIAKKYVTCASLYGGSIIGMFSLIIVLFAAQLSHLFVDSIAVSLIVRNFFLIVSIGYVCYMLTSSLLSFLSGLGKPEKSLLLMLVYYIVIRIPLAAILVNTTLQVNGIWLAILISHAAALGIAMVMYKRNAEE